LPGVGLPALAAGTHGILSVSWSRLCQKVVPERDFAISGDFTIVDGPVRENSLAFNSRLF